MNILKDLSKKYFNAFSNKKLELLKDMFADNIILRDWEIQAIGKKEVLAETEKILDSVKSIEVVPLHIYCEEDTVIAELEILIDRAEKIHVVDIISFNEEGKILGINAFKGNENY
jgi:hypothetical protein